MSTRERLLQTAHGTGQEDGQREERANVVYFLFEDGADDVAIRIRNGEHLKSRKP